MGYVVEENELMTNATGQAIAAAITANNNKANRSDIAPNFDIATSYSINDYVYYQSVLYRFTSAHSAGAWTGNDVEAVSLGTEIKNGVGKPKFVGSRSTWEGMPTAERKNYSEAIFPDEFEDETMAARNVSFDNTSTGMTATNTQNAITELKSGLTNWVVAGQCTLGASHVVKSQTNNVYVNVTLKMVRFVADITLQNYSGGAWLAFYNLPNDLIYLKPAYNVSEVVFTDNAKQVFFSKNNVNAVFAAFFKDAVSEDDVVHIDLEWNY